MKGGYIIMIEIIHSSTNLINESELLDLLCAIIIDIEESEAE